MALFSLNAFIPAAHQKINDYLKLISLTKVSCEKYLIETGESDPNQHFYIKVLVHSCFKVKLFSEVWEEQTMNGLT